jgi:hypothetical protein
MKGKTEAFWMGLRAILSKTEKNCTIVHLDIPLSLRTCAANVASSDPRRSGFDIILSSGLVANKPDQKQNREKGGPPRRDAGRLGRTPPTLGGSRGGEVRPPPQRGLPASVRFSASVAKPHEVSGRQVRRRFLKAIFSAPPGLSHAPWGLASWQPMVGGPRERARD